MVVWPSIFLWSLSLCAVARLARILGKETGSNKMLARVWILAIIAASVLLFRPHEDIFGGEDPGSYINSGVTYGRLNRFFYVDQMLLRVPAETRPQFYYGHSGFGTTKDACLWVRHAEHAIIGPNFQPAYPVLISVPARLAGPMASLYVVPLFALLAGLALAAFASQCLSHRWSGFTSFILWGLNPLVLWHGRCPRPEMVAVFFFFGGAALMLSAWRGKSWSRWPDIVLGALCVGVSPFFHISSLFLAVPAACAIACVILLGRSDFLLAPVSALIPMAAFVYQVRYVTDYYRLARFTAVQADYPIATIGVIVAGLLLLAGISLLNKRAACDHGEPASLPLAFGAGLALATIAFFVFSYATRDQAGSLPVLGRPIRHYLYMTNLKAYVNMISGPMALVVLAGWAAWLTGSPRLRSVRAVFALLSLPGIMLAGNINDFMMTRYLLITVVPVSALCTAALVTIPARRPLSPAFAGVLALALALAGLNNRSHLVTLTEHKGFARFLKPFAEIVIGADGILLGEYSRITAPFEHFFGIPALGLDNERKDDYSEQERVWEKIMKEHPWKAAFFLTPFQEPLSDRFDFALERRAVFTDRSLQQARDSLPTRIRRGPITLSLYRMTLKSETPEDRAPSDASVIAFDAGNMGLRRFANMRIRSWPVRGVEWHAGDNIAFDIPRSSEKSAAGELILLLMTDDPHPEPPTVMDAPVPAREDKDEPETGGGARLVQLADDWWFFRLRQDIPEKHEQIVLKASTSMFLAEAVIIDDDEAFSIMGRFSEDDITVSEMQPFRARWTRTPAGALVPVPPGGRGVLMILLEAPDTGSGEPVEFAIGSEPALAPIARTIKPGRWHWQVWPLRVQDWREDSMWLELRTDPAWDSGHRGFPPDLGVLVGYIVVLP